MSTLDNWVTSLPKEDQQSALETISELWDVFGDLEQKGYLLTTLRSKKRKDFPEILGTSSGLSDAFNMLFGIPTPLGEFVRGRNKEFVEHNRKYGFNDNRYVNLLLSESLSVFLRNIELFRSCFLFVLKTAKRPRRKRRNQRKDFYHNMGIGELLTQLVSICGSKAEKIENKIDWKLRNCLTHGLLWKDKWTIRFSKDITFGEQGEIRLDDLWKRASDQSKITQCLIELIPVWFDSDC